MTLRQLDLFLKAATDRHLLDLDRAYYTAYHAGLFSQPFKGGKFPKYQTHRPNTEHDRPASKQRQSWQHQKQMALVMNAAFGGRREETRSG
jgi:hypothetical protein